MKSNLARREIVANMKIKFKSIGSKIRAVILVFTVILCIAFGTTGVVLNGRTALDTLEHAMVPAAQLAANLISTKLSVYKTLAYETGCMPKLSSSTETLETKLGILEQKKNTYGLSAVTMVDKTGKSINTTENIDVSEREYFKLALSGNTVISNPIVSVISGELTTPIAAPVWQDGISGGEVAGVIVVTPPSDMLTKIIDSIQIGETGSAYIISQDGTLVAHDNQELVKNSYNTQEKVKTDSSLKGIAALEEKLIAGKTGFGAYKFQGSDKIEAYCPIPDTNGWGVAITAERQEFMSGATMFIIITIGLIALFIIIGWIVAVKFGNTIAEPIGACAQRMRALVQGDLHSPIPVVNTSDETKVLAKESQVLVDGLNTMLGDVGYLLGEMAKGRFNIKSRAADVYVGDFANLLESIREINRKLDDTLTQINETADQVAVGSTQVADASQELSQGAAEQASSVETMANSIAEISEQVQDNAESAAEANQKTTSVSHEMMVSNEKMQQMIVAMDEISQSSNEIGKIIKTIEDIAFQTNILALNAAVEAARAGAAGKGFAVVADEVRNLATKSQEASQNTTTLIESSVQAVMNGTKIVDETAASLALAVEGAKEVAVSVDKISTASEKQAASIAKVTKGIEEISRVVQTNSATSEESAAASEELSGQASMLKQLIGRFELRNTTDAEEMLSSQQDFQMDSVKY